MNVLQSLSNVVTASSNGKLLDGRAAHCCKMMNMIQSLSNVVIDLASGRLLEGSWMGSPTGATYGSSSEAWLAPGNVETEKAN